MRTASLPQPPVHASAATPPLRGRAGRVAGRLLGVVLVLAAVAKAVDPALFALEVAGLVPLPDVAAHAAAVAIVAFEAALGAALLAGARRPAVLLAANATFVAFVAIVGWQWFEGGDPARNCGCFGRLVERTPGEALIEDLALVALSAVAWLGGAARGGSLGAGPALLAGVAAAAFAVAAPRLPLDDRATALGPDVAVADTRLDQIVPELREGRHLVLLLDRADPAAPAGVALLNERLRLPGGPTRVWGVAPDDPQRAVTFLWEAGPAFEVRSAPAGMLRTLYRTLPRSALVDGGRVVATWRGLPDEPALEALARGDLP